MQSVQLISSFTSFSPPFLPEMVHYFHLVGKLPLTVIASVIYWSKKAGHFHEVFGMTIVTAGGSCFAVDTLTVDIQIA